MPENYYTQMDILTNELRKNKNQSTDDFIPIPSVFFFNQILKRHQNNCEILRTEFSYLSSTYLGQVKHMLPETTEDSTADDKTLEELRSTEKINFLYNVILTAV